MFIVADLVSLTLKMPAKEVCSLVNVSTCIKADSLDPRSDCSQDQSDLDLHCLSKTLQKLSEDKESRRPA